MSDEKKYTERDMVRAQREAFFDGTAFQQRCGLSVTVSQANRESAMRYPLPKVARPRVVTDVRNGERPRYWRFVDGQIQTKSGEVAPWVCLADGDSHATERMEGLRWTPERIQMLTDLLANPTEQCEVDE